jgi:hypothetical protein
VKEERLLAYHGDNVWIMKRWWSIEKDGKIGDDNVYICLMIWLSIPTT